MRVELVGGRVLRVDRQLFGCLEHVAGALDHSPASLRDGFLGLASLKDERERGRCGKVVNTNRRCREVKRSERFLFCYFLHIKIK